MQKKLRSFHLSMLLTLCLVLLIPGIASGGQEGITETETWDPEDTVILAHEVDARFSQDFSVLLKHLRLEWVILDSPTVPDSILDKNIVLIGHPDSEHTGEVIRGILTAEEVEHLRAAGEVHTVLEVESPWMEGRVITICSGVDMISRRNAAEEAIRAMVSSAPPTSDWIRTTYEAEPDGDIRGYVKGLQHGWDEAELPLEDLIMEVGAKPRRSITAQEAAEDVDHLFAVLGHGYSGYATYNQHGEFEQARRDIHAELSSKSTWSSDAFSELIHKHLNFIVDGHMRVGENRFFKHTDFWYDTQLEFRLGYDGYQFMAEGVEYTVVSIDDADPSSYLFPSLNQGGEPIYRVGLLFAEEPSSLMLLAESGEGERQFELKLVRSDFDYYSNDVFREDLLGGIPVVRVRGFGDSHPDELSQFVETGGDHRGEQVVILDIRGNGGGNERWPVSWIQRLTGQRAEAVFASSELESKTSMVGRANAFNYWLSEADIPSYESEAARYSRIAEAIESGSRQPGWTGIRYPQVPLIPNDTTIIVVTNEYVASAGEGLVMRISQAENVVVVGENTMGALTFGNLSAHQLPYSKLMVWMPINFGVFLDQEFREGRGLTPDLWVPAADAVNYAVAAVRGGTITTALPLSEDILGQDFTPENPHAKDTQERILSALVVAAIIAGGLVWAFFMRKKPQVVAGMGVAWIATGSALSVMERGPFNLGFLLVGVVCLAWGGVNLLKARWVPLETEK